MPTKKFLSLLVIVFSFSLLGATGAAAQDATDVYGETPGEELPTVDENPEVVVLPDVLESPAEVPAAEVAGRVESRGLPVTGGDVVGLAIIGGAAVLIGAGLMTLRRRQTA